MLRESLVLVGVVMLAVGLRSSRIAIPRKLGAVAFLAAGFLFFYFLTDCWWCGFFGVIPWFFLPWIELFTRIKKMRLPMENRLRHRVVPDPSFFPNAREAAIGMEEEGFEHVDDCGWEWSGMQQYFQIYWHPEERAEAAVCLCEQNDVAFAFISITSRDCKGRILRTTNFPFSPTLKCPSGMCWNHVPCERNSFHQILEDHRRFLKKIKIDQDSLRIPDPENIENEIEAEMRDQIQHNLDAGIIRMSGNSHFEYSGRGLFFLWGQFVKDMIRLC